MIIAPDWSLAYGAAAFIDKLTHENAVLKWLKFAAKSEDYSAEQKSLVDETLDMDLAAVAAEIEAFQPTPQSAGEKQHPKRTPLPPQLLRREIRHESDNTTCGCGLAMQRIGEVMAGRLHYPPGVFTVERHVRGIAAQRATAFLTDGSMQCEAASPVSPS